MNDSPGNAAPQRRRTVELVGWLAAGVGGISAGITLVLAEAVEPGIALVALGAGLLAVTAVRGWLEPAPADGSANEDLERLRQWLHEQQEKMPEGGASPSERMYHDLRLAGEGAGGSDAPGDPTGPTLDDREARLAKMIADRCDRVWEGIGDKKYVHTDEYGTITGINGGAIFAEGREVVEEVASLYHPDSDKAELEMRAGDVALTLRSTLDDVLHLARQIPVVDPATWTVRTVFERLEQARKGLALAGKGLALARKIEPYEPYINAASIAARIALGHNPALIVAWVAVWELAKRGGMAYAETWIKTVMESSIGLMYLRVAQIYEPARVYRSTDWIAIVEALRIQARIPGADHNRRLLLTRVLEASIPDEFAKLTLLRALAADRAPNAAEAPTVDLEKLQPLERKAVADLLSKVLNEMRGLNLPAASEAIEDVEHRLGRGLHVDLVASGSPAEHRAAEGFARLAAHARDHLDLNREESRHALLDTVFAAGVRVSAGADTIQRTIEDALSASYDEHVPSTPGYRDPPLSLVGSALAAPFVDSLVDLLARRHDGWPVEHDEAVLLHATVLLPDRGAVTRVWKRHLEAAATRLRGLLDCADMSAWPATAAPAILRQIGAANGAVATFEPTTNNGRPVWLLVFPDRLVVGDVPSHLTAGDDGSPRIYPIDTVRFSRTAGRLPMVDNLSVRCGDHHLTLAGPMLKSFEEYFRPLLEPLRLRADDLPHEKAAPTRKSGGPSGS